MFVIFQKMNDPQYSVMIMMAIYANVMLKQSPLSHTKVMMLAILTYILYIVHCMKNYFCDFYFKTGSLIEQSLVLFVIVILKYYKPNF